MPRCASTLFEDAIDVPLWLEADEALPYAQRARRDREIGKTLGARGALAEIRGWWHSPARGGADGAASLGARLERLRALLALAMIALGLIAGASLALAAFAYDGSQPVNVVKLLALLVGLQLLFLVLTLLLAVAGRVPGLRALQDLLAALNPGAWAASLLARFARADVPRRLFDWRARAGAGRFAKRQVLVWSQIAAVAFNAGALATAAALVTFTDLAFGWSTTLAVDPAPVTRIVHAIAWPWHAFVPSAVPDAALVERSQFFRLDVGGGGAAVGAGSRELGGWWPFTICAIVVYGLLPRVALLVVAGFGLRSATRRLLLDDPRVTALLDRMRSPAIETEAAGHDEPPAPSPAQARTLERPPGGRADAIVWERCIGADGARAETRRRFGLEVGDVLEAGGGRGLDADNATLERLDPRPDRTLVVLTPAWEPPVLELLDFLTALRARVGDGVSIVVVPLPDGNVPVTAAERETWQRAVGRLDDPRLYVEVGVEAGVEGGTEAEPAAGIETGVEAKPE